MSEGISVTEKSLTEEPSTQYSDAMKPKNPQKYVVWHVYSHNSTIMRLIRKMHHLYERPF